MLARMNAHITNNLWLWTAVSLAIAAIAAFARIRFGNGYYLGEIITLAAMLGGTTMIMISQQGLPRPAGTEGNAG